MTTKRELERLARDALGRGTQVTVGPAYTCEAIAKDAYVTVWLKHDCDQERELLADALRGIIEGKRRRNERELLAAAMRGTIAWKEGKE